MRCPRCDGDTQVIDSRPDKRGWYIARRRRCYDCGHRFTTEERPRGAVPGRGGVRYTRPLGEAGAVDPQSPVPSPRPRD